MWRYTVLMSKTRILVILGVWVSVLPYLGFPYSLKNLLLTLSGFGIIYVSYLLYGETKTEAKEKETFENFSENKDFVEHVSKDS